MEKHNRGDGAVTKQSLTGKLTRTVILLIGAMLLVWTLYYLFTDSRLTRFAQDILERTSNQIISELNDTFIQIEKLAYTLDNNEDIDDFIGQDRILGMTTHAESISSDVMQFQKHAELMEDVIVANNHGNFYRLIGNLNNTSVKKLLLEVQDTTAPKAFSTKLEKREYIVYSSPLHKNTEVTGRVIVLLSVKAIMKLFEDISSSSDIEILLGSDDVVLISDNNEYIGRSMSEVTDGMEYITTERIGFMPYEIVVSYESGRSEIRAGFVGLMIVLAAVLLIMFTLFLRFWYNKFFNPIGKVIGEVEMIRNDKTHRIAPTGLEHFDGLVDGINVMVEHLEQKDKEVYEVKLQREKALLVSLKKQINAHFTVNVLGAIKALAASGDNEKAGSLCDGLSFLLRYANAGESRIKAMEEFWMLQKYVDIMKIRYPGLFTVDIDAEDELEEIMIPRMLLQPIVENAIRHGCVGEIDRPGYVHIYYELTEKDITFVVEDNGKGMSAETLSELKKKLERAEELIDVDGLSHVALVNIERRLKSYFGSEYGLEIDSTQGEGTTVRIRIPLSKIEII